MKYLPLAAFLLLFAFGANAQTDDCNLLIHKQIKDQFIKSTKKEYIYNVPNRTLGIYVQNRNGSIQAMIDWDISPKALDATQKFNPNKPLMLTFVLKDGTSVVLMLEEFKEGSGAKKVRYANYMIGASVFLTPEQITALTKSPIVKVRETVYGIAFDDSNPLRADYWIRTIKCIQP
ncbi:hypothetical protein BH09BAC1_BH09BAC1_16360 [soil metagenome]